MSKTALEKWIEAKRNQQAWKDIETKLRSVIVDEFIGDFSKGTRHAQTPQGKLTASRSETYSYENKDGETSTLMEQFGPEWDEILVVWKPTVNKKGYEKLLLLAAQEEEATGNKEGPYNNMLQRLHQVLTIKSGAPQVGIK